MNRDDLSFTLFEKAWNAGLESLDQAVAVHDFLVSRDQVSVAAAVWRDMAQRLPKQTEPQVFLAWTLAMMGDASGALETLSKIDPPPAESPLTLATLALSQLGVGNDARAIQTVVRLRKTGLKGQGARERLLQSLERFDRRDPDNPCVFHMGAQLLLENRQLEVASVFIGMYEKHCKGESCSERLQKLESELAALSQADPPKIQAPDTP
jgi:hypothetical protein